LTTGKIVEKVEKSWRNLAIAVGVGAVASVGAGALASLALEMMLGGSSLSAVYERLETRAPAVAYSTTPSFTGAVPEPGTWALMVMGVGAVGVRLRARRPESQR
jgi:hypothetical protein